MDPPTLVGGVHQRTLGRDELTTHCLRVRGCGLEQQPPVVGAVPRLDVRRDEHRRIRARRDRVELPHGLVGLVEQRRRRILEHLRERARLFEPQIEAELAKRSDLLGLIAMPTRGAVPDRGGTPFRDIAIQRLDRGLARLLRIRLGRRDERGAGLALDRPVPDTVERLHGARLRGVMKHGPGKHPAGHEDPPDAGGDRDAAAHAGSVAS